MYAVPFFHKPSPIYILKINPSLPDADADCGKNSNVVGKGGAQYKKHGAFCLETQEYADAINHVSCLQKREKKNSEKFSRFSLTFFQANFPSIILNPGKVYRNETTYKFGITK
jgi:aldose 1-epimerase